MKSVVAVVFVGIAGAAVSAFAPGAMASEEIAKKAGCRMCHAVDKKMTGPSYREIAAKYKGQPDAVAKLSGSIRNGVKGVWGKIPMEGVPASKISDADLKAVVDWMLAQ